MTIFQTAPDQYAGFVGNHTLRISKHKGEWGFHVWSRTGKAMVTWANGLTMAEAFHQGRAVAAQLA